MRARARKTGAVPSQKEVEEHNLDHGMFRSWCPHCVKGRAESYGRVKKVQDRLAKGGFSVVKVKGEENVADGVTKHVDRQKMEQYMNARCMVRRSGRHELSPQFETSV